MKLLALSTLFIMLCELTGCSGRSTSHGAPVVELGVVGLPSKHARVTDAAARQIAKALDGSPSAVEGRMSAAKPYLQLYYRDRVYFVYDDGSVALERPGATDYFEVQVVELIVAEYKAILLKTHDDEERFQGLKAICEREAGPSAGSTDGK